MARPLASQTCNSTGTILAVLQLHQVRQAFDKVAEPKRERVFCCSRASAWNVSTIVSCKHSGSPFLLILQVFSHVKVVFAGVGVFL